MPYPTYRTAMDFSPLDFDNSLADPEDTGRSPFDVSASDVQASDVQGSDPQTPRRSRVAVPSTNPDDPRFLSPAGGGLDGVVRVANLASDASCSGSLLLSGRHILTAAHCLNFAPGVPNLNPDPASLRVRFDTAQGRTVLPISRVFVHPNWTADRDSNNDIAILELGDVPPDSADRYDIFRGANEVGQVVQRVGFGAPGTGLTGEVPPTTAVPIRRTGQNRYDTLGDIFSSGVIPGTQLGYDFDNGQPANDAIGQDYGIRDTGVGALEVGSSSGDSGGPGFINGQIAGIVSYGFSPLTPGVDVTDDNDTSFGEIFADTRVSAYAGWIDVTLAQSNAGNDNFVGTSRSDRLFSNAGNDTVQAGAGDDLVAAGRGNDVLIGSDGNDLLFGNRGSDAVDGGNGNDSLFGGRAADNLIGGPGDDLLSGDRARDVLTGGPGNDLFLLVPSLSDLDLAAADVITDFSAGDRLALAEGLVESQLLLQDLGGATAVRVQGTGIALGIVNNVTPAQLAGQFVSI